jgi:serine/threonine-protein kinase
MPLPGTTARNMRRKYLVLLTVLTTLVIACHKDHNKPSNGNGSTVTIPVIATTAVTQITDSSAVSGGSFTTDGDLTITTKGVQWDTAASFPNHWKASAGGGIGTFQATLSGLMPNTLYYVRAYVGTDTSTYYGNTVNFTTTYTPGKYLVSTVAGTGITGFANGDTSIATFEGPNGVAVDVAGNIYVTDVYAVRKITPTGIVSTLANINFTLNDLVVDTAGNVYVAATNFQIYKITPSGQLSVFAGSGQDAVVDGTGTSASFNAAITLAIDPAGNIYVGDVRAFRKITPAGVVTTLPNYFSTSQTCWTIGVDNHFSLYESDKYSVIKVDSSGNKTFLSGTDQPGNADGTGSAAAFGYISELRIDVAGNIYAADATNNKVRMITQTGIVTTIAGTGAAGDQDGNSAIATFNAPLGLALDNAGNIFVADAANKKVRKIAPL